MATTKLNTTQQQLAQQGAELVDNLDRAATAVTDSVVRMTDQVRQFIERKRAEAQPRRPSRDGLPAVRR